MKRLSWSFWMRRQVVAVLAAGSCAAAVLVPSQPAVAAGPALLRVATAVSAASPSTTTMHHRTIGNLLATLHNPATASWFGLSVAVSGTTAVIGAPSTNANAGAAYIYVKGASGWPTKPTATLDDPRG